MSKINQHQIDLQNLIQIYDRGKDKIFKGLQYLALILSWYYSNKQNLRTSYFNLFKIIFNFRRIYRMGHSVIFIPKITQSYNNLKKGISIQRTSLMISYIAKFIFYILDNIAVVMNFANTQYYKVVRRVSFSIFLVAILGSLIHYVIKLRSNFSKEAEFKSLIVKQLTPKQFLKKLAQLDDERWGYTLEILSNVGDLLPTLQRMNFPSAILRTRANKGVSGGFGLLSAVAQFIKTIRKP